MCRILTSCLLLMVLLQPTPVPAQGNNPPQLKVLESHLGTWKMTVAVNGLQVASGELTGKWILNGRFLEQTGVVKTSDGSMELEVRTMMTFDEEKQVYRTWRFLSNGMTIALEGNWSEATRTMTSISQEQGKTMTFTQHLPENGPQNWRMVSTAVSGFPINVDGTNTRVEK